ncbi:hypothetical protein QFC20_002757 [Naganishia adeliensis]|uniref:Uncharacterized protein n=1 Tax=Naganishia adeliensis TaxID=92952 RepID=A0ACC2WI16_9TREE|nr:hypothetical protein QFC20_002757 [Naganishia adeliensis]
MADFTAVPVHTRTRFPLNLAVATLFTLAASVCLWLAAFSTPFIKRIYYLGINRQGGSTRFGTFGYCYGVEETRCIPRDVGYRHDLIPNSEGLTGALILTPIAAGLAALAAGSLVVAWFRHRGAVVGFLLTAITTLTAVLSFVLALVAFVTAHHRASSMKFDPRYGAALWLHMVGVILLVLALPFTLLAWLRQRKNAKQTVITTTTSYRP